MSEAVEKRVLLSWKCILESKTADWVKENKLCNAVYMDNLGQLVQLKSGGADINVLDCYKSSLLHVAAERGNINTSIYLSALVPVDGRDCHGRTPAHIAASEGHVDLVELLLTLKADPNTRDCDGVSVLQAATTAGHLDVVKVLVNVRADPNVRCNRGTTALQLAIKSGFGDIVAVLIGAKADLSMIKLEGCKSILHIAAAAGNDIETIRQLIINGADVNACKDESCSVFLTVSANVSASVLNLLTDIRALVLPDSSCSQALICAAVKNNMGLVNDLLAKGVRLPYGERGYQALQIMSIPSNRKKIMDLVITTTRNGTDGELWLFSVLEAAVKAWDEKIQNKTVINALLRATNCNDLRQKALIKSAVNSENYCLAQRFLVRLAQKPKITAPLRFHKNVYRF